MAKKPERPPLFWMTYRHPDGRAVASSWSSPAAFSMRASWLRWPVPIEG
jgi:hypothetical protein